MARLLFLFLPVQARWVGVGVGVGVGVRVRVRVGVGVRGWCSSPLDIGVEVSSDVNTQLLDKKSSTHTTLFSFSSCTDPMGWG